MIQADHVVHFRYRLSDAEGGLLEHSDQPMAYLHGHRNIIPGLEAAMAGRTAGEQFSVTVPPEQGYGLRQDGSRQRVPLKHLVGVRGRPKAGSVVWVQTDQGQRQVTVVKAGQFMVEVDTNHPLAGQTLRFEIEIVSVREATAEELAHGHVHGEGGHEHG